MWMQQEYVLQLGERFAEVFRYQHDSTAPPLTDMAKSSHSITVCMSINLPWNEQLPHFLPVRLVRVIRIFRDLRCMLYSILWSFIPLFWCRSQACSVGALYAMPPKRFEWINTWFLLASFHNFLARPQAYYCLFACYCAGLMQARCI